MIVFSFYDLCAALSMQLAIIDFVLHSSSSQSISLTSQSLSIRAKTISVMATGINPITYQSNSVIHVSFRLCIYTGLPPSWAALGRGMDPYLKLLAKTKK